MKGVRTLRAALLGVGGGLLWLGCAAPTGGWDVARLLEERPDVAAIAGARLGDLTPYPALLDGEIALITCRYAFPGAIRVRGGGPGWPPTWAHEALGGFEAGIPGVAFVELEVADPRPAEIVIRSLEEATAEGPRGLADTLTECDVRPAGSTTGGRSDGVRSGRGKVRGVLLRSEVRIRRTQPGVGQRVHRATREEWTAALLHELGHALGFVGHVTSGRSVLTRDEFLLREFARRAIRGEAVRMPSLEALYAVEPGRVLGRADLAPEARVALSRFRRRLDEMVALLGEGSGARASAGDRSALLVWRWPSGETLRLHFPAWRRQLREGIPLDLWWQESADRKGPGG